MRTGFVELPDSDRPVAKDAKRVDDVRADTPVEVTVTLSGPRLPDLDPGAPGIPRGEFAARYGTSPDVIEKVRETLERLGLEVGEVSPAARSMRVKGSAGAMEDAFNPGLGIYSSPTLGRFRGREGKLEIPAELEDAVTGVFGLDERRMARRAKSVELAEPAAHGTGSPLGPVQLAEHYNFPPGDGAGQLIGLAELGGTYFPDDLQRYRQKYGLPETKVEIVDAGATPPTPEQLEHLPAQAQKQIIDEAGEVMLDVEIVAGLCPAAKILVFFSTFSEQGWIDLLTKVMQDGPQAVDLLSVSWGLAEDNPEWSGSALREIDLRLKEAAQQGITICVAAGDDGSGDMGEDGHCHVNFPASSPYVLSVGGTMIADGGEERVWWQEPGHRFLPDGESTGGGATGGGISKVFTRPTWQNVQEARPELHGVVEAGIDGRIVPDVAALAGPPCYELIFQGEANGARGTSAATPLWAALLTRIRAGGRPAGGPTFLTPLLYQAGPGGEPRGKEACRDVTVGDNTSHPDPGVGFRAGPGYDALSGWGVPDGEKLLASLPAASAAARTGGIR